MKAWLAIPLAAAALLAQSDREQMLWRSIRDSLLRDPAYFDVIRGSAIPVYEGTVVAMDPPTRPNTLLIGIETPLVAELRLHIRRDGDPARMTTTPVRKSKIRFRAAVVAEWKKQPFLLTAEIDERDLDFEDIGGLK